MAPDWSPLWLSLRVAASATLIAAITGVPMAYLLSQRSFRGKPAVETVLLLPLVLPPTVLGYYLLALAGRQGALGAAFEAITGHPLLFGWRGATIAATIPAVPVVMLCAKRAFAGARELARTAYGLGAGAWRTFWQVTLPLSWRPLAGALLVVYARAAGEFGITLMIAGGPLRQTETIATAVYRPVETGASAGVWGLLLAASALGALSLWASNRVWHSTG
jgi:molybdate transport system permease protein